MKIERITRQETGVFATVLEKLVAMSAKSRRSNPCWKTMRSTLDHLGNWKNAPRGKPTPTLRNLVRFVGHDGVRVDSQNEFP